MTFLSGVRLLLLVVPVALLVAYVIVLRRRRVVAVRFSSVDLLASVAPRRSGWQRFLPWTALLAAIVVGVLAFAQPAWAMRTPKERATIMLTLDVSASMTATDVKPSRLAAAQASARSFVESLPDGLQVGLITYSESASLVVPPTTDRAALVSGIDGMRVGTGTGTAAGIELALSTISGVPPAEDGQRAPSAIVLMSDGSPTVGVGGQSPEQSVADAAQQAKADGVPVTTIAFGTSDGTVTVRGRTIPVPYDPEAMAAIAEETGGQTFTAESASDLASAYDEIGGTVGYDVETVELTAVFAGLAMLLAALAAAGALVWGPHLA